MKNKSLKIIIIIASIIIGILLSVVVIGNAVKGVMFHEFYSLSDVYTINPGLSDRFVTQGVCVCEDENVVMTSGYMMDKGKPSRIYIVKDGQQSYVELYKDDKPFTGHVGGMATTKDKVYLANGSKIYVLNLSDVLSKDKVDVGEGIKVLNKASFVFTDESYLYVGEFNDGKKYVTKNINETNDGTYHAIITKYSLEDLNTPICNYAIRDRVQGCCVTDDNKMVLCTSYGLTNTVYYIYDLNNLTVQHSNEGIDTYYLDNIEYKFSGVAMGEDLDFSNGKVITLSEIASNKYIIGKFLFEDKIYALDLDKIKK